MHIKQNKSQKRIINLLSKENNVSEYCRIIFQAQFVVVHRDALSQMAFFFSSLNCWQVLALTKKNEKTCSVQVKKKNNHKQIISDDISN